MCQVGELARACVGMSMTGARGSLFFLCVQRADLYPQTTTSLCGESRNEIGAEAPDSGANKCVYRVMVGSSCVRWMNLLWLCRVGGHCGDRGHDCHVDLSCGRRSYTLSSGRIPGCATELMMTSLNESFQENSEKAHNSWRFLFKAKCRRHRQPPILGKSELLRIRRRWRSNARTLGIDFSQLFTPTEKVDSPFQPLRPQKAIRGIFPSTSTAFIGHAISYR